MKTKTLKDKLREHYQENEADFDQEETDNVLEILDECDQDDLSDASKWSLTLLRRMINNDDELSDAINSLMDDIIDRENEENEEDIFD